MLYQQIYRPSKLIATADDSPAAHRVRDDAQAHVPEADHGQLSGPEDPGVSEVPRQAGADARRERTREVRRLRAVRGGVPGRRDLSRGGGKRRHACRPARATPRSTRFTRRAASSAATARRPAPCRAIFMGKDYELAVYSNKDFIWDKADLLGASRQVIGDSGIAADRRARRHPRRLRRRPRRSCAAPRGAALAVRRRHRSTTAGVYSRSARRFTGSTATTKTST